MILKGKLADYMKPYDFQKALDEYNEKNNSGDCGYLVECISIYDHEKNLKLDICHGNVIGKIINTPLKISRGNVLIEIELTDTHIAKSFKSMIQRIDKRFIPYQISMKGTREFFIETGKWGDLTIKSFMVTPKFMDRKYNIEVIA